MLGVGKQDNIQRLCLSGVQHINYTETWCSLAPNLLIGTVDNVSIFPYTSILVLENSYLRKWYPFYNILDCEVFEYSAKRSFELTNVIERSEAKKERLKQLSRTRQVERILSFENFWELFEKVTLKLIYF